MHKCLRQYHAEILKEACEDHTLFWISLAKVNVAEQ